MNRESEILKDKLSKVHGENVVVEKLALSAMQELARERAIGFGGYLISQRLKVICKERDNKTDAQFYDEYLSQLKEKL